MRDMHNKPFPCSAPNCPKAYADAYGCKRHESRTHGMHEGPAPLYCPYSSCPRSTSEPPFARPELLNNHIAWHEKTNARATVTRSSGLLSIAPAPQPRQSHFAGNANATGRPLVRQARALRTVSSSTSAAVLRPHYPHLLG